MPDLYFEYCFIFLRVHQRHQCCTSNC